MNKAAFLDRDGTINVDGGYIYKKEEFKFIKGSIDAIRLLQKKNFKIIVVTNQSGIGRGMFDMDDVNRLHKYINDELREKNASIDRFYICPHHPKEKCNCRKPKILLFQKAISDFSIDPKKSIVIGDKKSDIIPGIKIGAHIRKVNGKKLIDVVKEYTGEIK